MSKDIKPLILVTADVIEHRRYRWHAAIEFYLTAVTDICGAVPLLVPSLGEGAHMQTLLAHADGILATGARSNVHPAAYGGTPDPAAEPYDQARDATALPLMRAAVAAGVPLLAICRGLQELNVAFGGSLHPEVHALDDRFDHRGSDAPDNDQRFAIVHPVRLKAGSRLAAMMGADTIRVNSVHRQGIDRLGPGLAVEAVAEDGTIEAVAATGTTGFALGVQWHPEYWAMSDPPSRRIFESFGEAVRDHHLRRATVSAAAE